ncbi:MAG: DUF2232 domain-containing protein [Candidatus Tokpelaia sp.]|nr:MAG: DUF2232 domain-containing protein [Candidatus Tokpelaia sp.]KAA6206945.1 MAG: DUF2232 domain-containing protein [Candidatus Tokpelaia sp.]
MIKEKINIKAALAAAILSAASIMLLWFTLFNIPFLPVFFGIGVNIPVLFVLFSYGWQSGLAAALLAGLFSGLVLPAEPALLLAFFFFLPALFTGWLLGLQTNSGQAKPGKNAFGEQNLPQFYPLPAAIFQLALIIAFVTIAVLFYSFSNADKAQAFNMVTSQIADFIAQKNFYNMPAQSGDIHNILQHLLPVLLAVSLALYGFLFQLAAIYCAMRLARRNNSLRRPFGYWPADLRLPPMALFLFIGLWLASYFIGNAALTAAPTLTLCVNTILAVLAAGFCVSGLAVLHQTARGSWSWLRFLIYICLFSLVLTPIIFFGLVIMGLFATPFPSARQSGNPPLP